MTVQTTVAVVVVGITLGRLVSTGMLNWICYFVISSCYYSLKRTCVCCRWSSECTYRRVLYNLPCPAARHRCAALCRGRQTEPTCHLEETVSSQPTGDRLK